MNINEAREYVMEQIASMQYSYVPRRPMTGRVSYRSRVVSFPEIKTRKSLYIACHELGHIVHGMIRPVYVGEYRAEKYAHDLMRTMGFSVPRSMTIRAKRYVSMKIRRAKKRGLKSVSSPISAWANKGLD